MTVRWTADRVALARKLQSEGQSAAAIARELGGVSRSAVCGLLYRLVDRHEPQKERPAPRKKPPARAVRVCAVPGCGAGLSGRNLSGVCAAHVHAAGLCRCPACLGAAPVVRAAPVARPGTRSVAVPTAGYSNTGGPAFVRVSLPREPWSQGGSGDV